MDQPLLPPDIAKQIPGILEGPGFGNRAYAYAKLNAAWIGRRWYVSLFDPADRMCWTKYVGPEGAAFMGISLDTLESMRGPSGERVERDDAFTARPLAECEPGEHAVTVRREETL